MNRRDFLRVASILSGSAAASCELAKAPEKLIPYLVPPDDGIIPGTSHTVRSTCTECPAACGVDVKIMEGRPVKLEGNPDHPLNAGALCVRGQASIERLYQPARQPRPAVRASDGARLGVTRCVGTRYCANNCPYKARRFNWLDHPNPAPLDKLVNPEVSVRPKGVMEKCTFCIQRIRAAKDHAKDEKRPVADGEFTTACAQTCPTGAITFGNLKDETSKVSKLAHSDRAYRVLEEIGTRPSVYYLKSPPSKKTRKG